MDPSLTPFAQALGQVESGNNYSQLGPVTANGDRAYGRYQVMGSNIPSWTAAATGKSLTPREFLENSDAQDAVFAHRFGGSLQQFGNPQDAASVWFSGRPMAQAGKASDGYNTEPQYVDKFNKALGALSGKTPMADPTQQQPALYPQQQQPVLFGGNPTPVGGFGAIGRMLGIGTEPDLGRRLQNAGAGLISIADPSGGARLQMAANEPHFNVVTDALGNRYMMDTRTGRTINPGAPGGAAGAQQPDQNPSVAAHLAQSPVALAELAKTNAAASQKKMEALDDAAAKAQGSIDQNNEAMRLSKLPDVIQGPGVWNMLREKLAENTNGSLGGVDLSNQAALEKINKNLVASMLSAQQGVRFAYPEIKFGETASADTLKPAEANQQIYSNNKQNLQRAIDVRNIARAHMAHYGVLGPEFSRDVEEYQNKHPVYQDTPEMAAKQGNKGNSGFKILSVTEPK